MLWVVVDSQINPAAIEMYADPAGRGGVLEPEGMVRPRRVFWGVNCFHR